MNIKNCNYPVDIRISQIINRSGLKQCAVAERAGYKVQTLNDMMNGRRLIKPHDIVKLAQVLGVSPNDLFEPDSQPPTH